MPSSLRPRFTTTFTFTGRPAGRGGVDALEHLRDREVDVVHRAERRVVERVEADGHAREARVGERLRLLRQQRRRSSSASGRGVERARASRPAARRRRRTSGSPPVMRSFATPFATNARASRVISSKSSSCARGRKCVVAAEDLLRHAVDAAEVAAVGDRDAQVAQRAAEHDPTARSIGSAYRSRRRSLRGSARCCSSSSRPSGASRSCRSRTRSRSIRSSRSSPCASRSPSLTLSVPAAPRMRTLGGAARVVGAGSASLLAAGYALQTAGLERTTVSAAGFVTGMYVMLTPVFALALFRMRVATGRCGSASRSRSRARDAERRLGRLDRRRPARPRRAPRCTRCRSC